MPILAMIIVHQCEGCQKIESIDICKSEEYTNFEKDWAIGLLCSFCPKCKDSGFAKARLAGENKSFNQVKAAKAKVAKVKGAEGYVN